MLPQLLPNDGVRDRHDAPQYARVSLGRSTRPLWLLADPDRRQRIAAAGRRRCLSSGYSTLDRARQMMDVIRAKLEQLDNATRTLAENIMNTAVRGVLKGTQL